MKSPGFYFYPGDYLRDTQNLSEKTQVAYDRIMCEHMRNICISKQQLKFFTKRLSELEIEELMLMLTPVEGGFQIDWVAESISKYKSYSQSRSENRRKKSDKHMNNLSKTYENHMEIEIEEEKENVFILNKGGVGEKIEWEKVGNFQWFESVVRFLQFKITIDQLMAYWEQYKQAMEADDDLYREAISYRSHFRNWVKIQVEKSQPKTNCSSIMKADYELAKQFSA